MRGAGGVTPRSDTPFFILINDEFALGFLHLISPYCSVQYTVTSRDVNFRCPDRVPQTQFVHIAKKVFSICAWIFPARKVFRTLRVPGSIPFCIPKCWKNLPVSGRQPFTFPSTGKFWSLEPGQVSLQKPDFYGMKECKMSHSGDRKTFPAFGNAKGLLPGTRRVFWYGGMWKRSIGGGENVLVSAAGLSIRRLFSQCIVSCVRIS